MKTLTLAQKRTPIFLWRGLITTTATTLLLAAPTLAEAPLVGAEDVLQTNINRLTLLNECRGCDLEGAVLSDSHFIGADLRGANLQRANLANTNMEGADLRNANLTDADLSGAFLTNASLVNATLDGVNFSGAYLYYVDVAGASMKNINLAGAQLRNTPIYVGGEEQMLEENVPLEPVIPFEETLPPEALPILDSESRTH